MKPLNCEKIPHFSCFYTLLRPFKNRPGPKIPGHAVEKQVVPPPKAKLRYDPIPILVIACDRPTVSRALGMFSWQLFADFF